MKSPWSTKKLLEICEKVKKEKATINTTPYVEIGNIDVQRKKINLTNKGAVRGSVFAPENSILISRVRPTRGAVVFLDKKIAVSPAFTILKPKENYSPKILFYFLAWNKKFFEYLGSKQKGTNYPSVREKDILEFDVTLPEDVKIQQKIVYVLDTIQEAVEVQEKIIEKTKELKKSVMADLFKYGGPSFRKGRKLKKTEIGEIPEDWKVVRLGEEIQFTNGKRPIFTEKGNIPIYGANGIMGFTNQILVNQPFVLIIGRVGAAGEIHLAQGRTWISDNAIYSKNYNKEKIEMRFVKEYLIFKGVKKLSTRSTHPIITKSLINHFKIPFPPLSEQREIAEILQTIDQKIEIEQKKKALYEELFKTMLNKIMKQEIDVEKIKIPVRVTHPNGRDIST